MRRKIFFLIMFIISGLTAQNNQYLKISWEMPAGTSLINGFRIFSFSNNTDTLNPLDSLSVSKTVTETLFTGLNTGQTYYFRVIAYNDSMRSPFSDPIAGYIATRSNAESNLQVNVTENSATIQWQELDPNQAVVTAPITGKIKWWTDSLALLNGSAGNYTNPVNPTGSSYLIQLNNLQSDTKYYFFLVENDNNGNVYTTDVLSFKTGQFVQPDQYEPNDDFASATALALPANIDAYIVPADDPDYYRIQIPDSVDSLIVLLNPPGGSGLDMRIELFNQSQQSLQSTDQNGANQGESLIYENPSQGEYYLLVTETSGQSDATNPYNLQIQLSYVDSDTGGGVIDPDHYEPNDNFAQATNFVPDSTYNAYIFQSGDVDVYRFDFSGSQNIQLSVNQIPFDLQATIYNQQQLMVQNFQVSGQGTTTPLNISNGYFLELRAVNVSDESNTNSYALLYTVVLDTTPTFNPEKPVFSGPNPFVEGKTNDTGFHFRNLAAQMKIEIYTLSLEKVWEYVVSSSDGAEVIWELKNRSGQHIVSGVYLVIVKDPTGKVVEQTKLVYIR